LATVIDGEPELAPILNRIFPDGLVYPPAMPRNVPSGPTIADRTRAIVIVEWTPELLA